MPSAYKYLGVGLYQPYDAARYMGINPVRATRWAYGYKPHENRQPPVFNRAFAGEGRVLSFLDMIELKLIAMFRKHGVSMKTIREAAAWAERTYGTSHPFTLRRFDTDGKNIFATMRSTDEQIMAELPKAQNVFEEFVRPFFVNLDWTGDDQVLRYYPEGFG